MALIQLKLDSLKDLDFGRPAAAFDASLQDAVRDCLDRAGDKRPRKIALEFVITPILDQAGTCEEVRGEFKVKTSLPNRQTKVYAFGVKKTGQLYFSETCPENVDQLTIDDLDEDGRAKRKVK